MIETIGESVIKVIRTSLGGLYNDNTSKRCIAFNTQQLADRISKKYDKNFNWVKGPNRDHVIKMFGGTSERPGDGYIDEGYNNIEGIDNGNETQNMRNYGLEVPTEFLDKYAYKTWFSRTWYFKPIDYATWYISQHDKNGDGNLQADESEVDLSSSLGY